MNKKKKIIIAIVSTLIAILLLAFGIYKYQSYMQQDFTPGKELLEKKGIALIYCSQNPNMKKVINIIDKKIKMDFYELKPAVAYPTEEKAFKERVQAENENLDKVIYENSFINLKKYKFIVIGTPIVEGEACPLLKKFIKDNNSRMDKKPVSFMVLVPKNQTSEKATTYLMYRLMNTIEKPNLNFMDYWSNQEIEGVIDSWIDQMQFKQIELR